MKEYFRNKKPCNVTFNANSNSNSTEKSKGTHKKWICENIDFSDLNYENTEFIVNVDKHVFYRNIYVFIDRLKDMTMHKNSNKLKNVISQCLRKLALIWHFTKLSDLEKNMRKKAFLTLWYNVLTKRFKQHTSAILINIQTFRYTLKNARKQQDSRIFAQDFFKHGKAIDIISTHNQIVMT